jgi:endo-1,4-beta-D-glucanase Y
MKQFLLFFGGIVLFGLLFMTFPNDSNQVAARAKFPYNAKYPYGQASLNPNQAVVKKQLLTEWNEWKKLRITASGAGGYKRVQRDAKTNYDTVSEGLGYGLLLAVYFDDQALFDDLYHYVKKYSNQRGLMSWHIDAEGNTTSDDGGVNGASDADEDIAVALVFASKKWGDSKSQFDYTTEARTYIDNIYQWMIEPDTYILKPGDVWGGTWVTNPSYYAPAWYRIFADFTGNKDWITIANTGYDIVDQIKQYNKGTGLVPDWCQSTGEESTNNALSYNFKYDAIRYQWRTAIDYCWYGEKRALANIEASCKFFQKIGAANILDGYTITGDVIGTEHTAGFVTMCASATMAWSDRALAKEFYNETWKVKNGRGKNEKSYYEGTLRLMVLLFMTGNFPNLYMDK